jgi:formate hydrogenlyase subunit 3/multisubunit Na+/H+ antiporter MnhD subunit
MNSPEPRNPLYLPLLAVCVLFIMTALAYALVPTLEEKAFEAGMSKAHSPFRDALLIDGWKWLLYEVAAVIALGIACMGLDQWRSSRSDKKQ